MTPAAEFIFDLQPSPKKDQNQAATQQLQDAAANKELPIQDDFNERLQAVLNQTKLLVQDWQAKRATH
ncbi:MAG TPA: hypothetical protein VK171_16090 [Fimbriimonas sp.]|nr:hypothetical protein [Fimbriimonas sp.]